MKQRLLLALACTTLAVGGWAIWVSACDRDKQTSTRPATQTASSKDACASHATTSAACAHDGAKISGCSHGANASAMTASISGCGHDAANGTITTAGYSGDASMNSLAGSGHGCDKSKGATAKNGASCTMHSTSVAMHNVDCDACSGVASCQEQLRSAGATMQVVPLKNGVMYVYTAESAENVRAIQTALARRTSRLTAIENSGDRAKLCPECKTVRGAIASGKLTRETVNIEGGCMTLMTSNDPAMVTKLHSMAGLSNGRTKS